MEFVELQVKNGNYSSQFNDYTFIRNNMQHIRRSSKENVFEATLMFYLGHHFLHYRWKAQVINNPDNRATIGKL